VNITDSSILKNLHVPGITQPDQSFERTYIQCRTREERMYTDEEVTRLPKCAQSHPHYGEWVIREASCRKLYTYLVQKRKPLTILEIGCGNGWMLHQLSRIPQSKLTGLDVNFTELQQAARVFSENKKMGFIYGDLRSGILGERRFDIILFAASIQYFKSLNEILELCLQHLNPDGEIHITDTKFYRAKEITAAKQRSENYFDSLGFPEMAGHYFHHSFPEAGRFNYEILYDPHSLFNKLTRRPLPFHWTRIKKDLS
jgi:ubiquinone/menaquinone biosynthesis C-methylase UbiE